MSLVQKGVTARLVVANRANSQKSTGPRTELGKRNASRNAGKHLILARIDPSTMKQLGENPAEFVKLRDSLRQAFEPQDGFEEMLVEDMVNLRWRLGRLHRAESGLVASNRRKFEIDRQWEKADYRIGSRLQMESCLEESECSVDGLSDSPEKFQYILDALRELQAEVKTEGFREEGLRCLEVIYGSARFPIAEMLKARFASKLEARDTLGPEAEKMNRESFVRDLEEEIHSFEKLARLDHERDVELTDSMKDAKLLPSQDFLENILKYESHLEHHFEKKLQLLAAYRRARAESPALPPAIA